ncbi:MAG: hypothetical protein ABSB35_17740 [Bryobacteraceae bacterium]
MSGLQDQDRLLHAMAWETANVHLGTTRATQRVIADLKSRPGKWLRAAVRDMAGALRRLSRQKRFRVDMAHRISNGRCETI